MNIIYNEPTREVNYFFNKICFWGITIDILFLPYLPFMAVSASVVLVALWLLVNFNKVYHDREGNIFVFMFVFMIFGTLVNLLYDGNVRIETSFFTAVKRLFQYLLCFGAYFFYKDYFSRHKFDIKKVLFIAIIYIAVFATVYRLVPHEYAIWKIAINPADVHTKRYLANAVHYRFNYLWTDPNNISYLIAGICAWFLLQKQCSNTCKLFVLIASTYIAFCTVSNGGLIMLIAMCIIVFVLAVTKAFQQGVRRNTFLFFIALLFGLILLFRFTNVANTLSVDYLSMFSERRGLYTSSSGGRLEDLLNSIEYLNPIMLFMGTGNEGFSYEIGHIYWIGMYGVPAYCMFLWLMFRKDKWQRWIDCLWILPFFVGFTMNIAIGEYKWMAIYLMLLAYSRNGENKMGDVLYGNEEKI